MKKIILIIIVLLGWYGNYKYKQNNLVAAPTKSSIEINEPTEQSVNSNYNCDGRTHCSQWTATMMAFRAKNSGVNKPSTPEVFETLYPEPKLCPTNPI